MEAQPPKHMDQSHSLEKYDEHEARLEDSTKGYFLPRSRFVPSDFERTYTLGNTVERREVIQSRQDRVRSKSPLHNFRMESINSVSSFVKQVYAIRAGSFREYGARFDSIRLLAGTDQTTYVGQGYSFSVDVVSNRHQFTDTFGEFPEMKLKQHQEIAVKIPKVEPTKDGLLKSRAGLRAYSLQAVAWEAHCLFHPPVHESPHIVQLLDISWEAVEETEVGVGGPVPISNWTLVPSLVLEYADQGTLDDLLKCNPCAADFELKMKLLSDIAHGLQALHNCGIVHCDLKATNILLFSHTTQELVAKISDFGCAAHNFGPEDTIVLPPYWPRWDAPEVRPMKPPIDIDDLPAVDIYPFGLIAWQLVHNGRTPFDRGRSVAPLFEKVESFRSILDATEEGEKRAKIAELKDMDNNCMLEAVETSIKLLDIDACRLNSVLSHSLLRNPAARWKIGQFCDYFERYCTVTEGGLEQAPAAHDPTMPASSFSSEAQHPNQDFALPALFRNFPAESSASEMISHLRSRMFLDFGASTDNARAFDPIVEDGQIVEWPVKQLLYEEFREAVESGTYQDSLVFIQLGLSKMIGFGCEKDPEEGTRLMCQAATMGNSQAQALAWRLGEAHGGCATVAESFCRDWLAQATSQGSLIAYEDLRRFDPDCAREHRRIFTAQNAGLYGTKILAKKKAICDGLGSYDTELLDGALIEHYTENPVEDLSAPRDVAQHTILHYAAVWGCLGLARHLIKRGADPDQSTIHGETVLMLACRYGHADIVRLLLEHKADVKKANTSNVTVLHYLIYLNKGEIDDITRSIIISGADVNAQSDTFLTHTKFICEEQLLFGTPLHWAVACNRDDLVGILLEYGAEPLQNRPDGLQDAHQAGIQLPVDLKYNLSPTSPTHIAAQFHRREILEALVGKITEFEKQPRLHQSLVEKAMSTPELQMMCSNGPNHESEGISVINLVKGAISDAALMEQAISSRKIFYVKHLVKSGYQLDPPIPCPESGFDALAYSLSHSNGDITLYLLENGARPLLKVPELKSPLEVMAFYPETKNRNQIVQLFVEMGYSGYNAPALYTRAVVDGWDYVADKLTENNPKCDYLQLAVYKNLLRLNSQKSIRGLIYLLQRIPSILRDDPVIDYKTGNTLLHHIVMVDEYIRNDLLNERILKMLLTKFGDKKIINTVNKRGLTAIATAAQAGNHNAMRILQSPETIMDGTLELVMGRVILPDQFDGDVKSSSSEGTRQRRHEENTMKSLSLLLHKFGRATILPKEVSKIVEQEKETWWRTEFIRDAFQKALVLSYGKEGVVLHITNDKQQIFEALDEGKGKRNPMTTLEYCVGLRYLWEAIHDGWSTRKA